MKKHEFVGYLHDPSKISNEHLDELEELIEDYPYFQTARALLAKIKKEKEPDKANPFIAKAAVYVTDRALLKKYLSDKLFFLELPPESTPEDKETLTVKKEKPSQPKKTTSGDPDRSPKSAPEKPKSTTSTEGTDLADSTDTHLDDLIEEIYQDMENLRQSKERFREWERKYDEEQAVSSAVEKATQKTAPEKEEPKEQEKEEPKEQEVESKSEDVKPDSEEAVEETDTSKEEPSSKASTKKVSTGKTSASKSKKDDGETKAKQTKKKKTSTSKTTTKKTATTSKTKTKTKTAAPKKTAAAKKSSKAKEKDTPAKKESQSSTAKKSTKSAPKAESPKSDPKSSPSSKSSSKTVTSKRQSASSDDPVPKRSRGDRKQDEKPVDQKKIISEFIDKEPGITPAKKGAKKPEKKDDLSEKSTRFHADISSEYLAEIYIEQGKYRRAIEIYESLMLKFPEKESFFAARIDQLKKRS